jgi:hypothetical protein
MFKALFMLACALVAPCAAAAQTPPAEMQRVAFLIGHWQGQGWIDGDDGRRQTFQQRERVEPRADGAALSIEGRGESDGVLVHSAFGVLAYDINAEIFRWFAVESAGDQVVTEAGVSERQLIWTLAAGPSLTLRYTIRIDERGRWFEIGERSNDGQSWQQFFEQTLEKCAD